MNKKLFVLVVVCLLFAAACAHPFRKPSIRHKEKKKANTEMYPERDVVPLPTKPDFMFPGRLENPEMEKALGTQTARRHHHDHQHHHHHDHDHEHHHSEHDQEQSFDREHPMSPFGKLGCGKNKNKNNKMKDSVVLVPGKLTEAVINWGTHFSIEVSRGNALAVQVVHSSTKYIPENGRKPELSLCRVDNRNCISEKNNTLSFELDAAAVNSFLGRKNKANFNFVLTTTRTSVSGVVADLYACVGTNATLATCVTPVVIGCVMGKQSKDINVCICDDGYTGKRCDEKATKAPKFYEYDEDFEEVFQVIGTIFAIVFNIVFYVIIFVLITCCCACCRACCQRRRANRGSIVRNRTYVPQPQPRPQPQPIIPPPMYAYRPLNVPPPPPPPPPSVTIVQPMPPPQPQPSRRYDPYAAEGIEMTTIPAKPASTVYVMPPLAPVKQVPVYIQPPPAPKN